ncbi:hypothetical protein GDO86_013531 [Hymenochirus boettgeri]|uniref:Taste receptor type 2 n=1 Tax=Hymenochirus boettgeri TaxID=247094 RepID=A0A8T2IRN6_9PIPI|nr:hypothetical protein GDO86_013531 [Hymenochirus boettgeri]
MENFNHSSSQTSDQAPSNSYQSVSMGIIVFETLLGSLANGFMVLKNLLDLMSHGHLGSCDYLLIGLGLSRFAFLWVLFISYLMNFLQSSLGATSILSLFLVFNNTSLWFATWLCVFYCIRIVDIQNRVFVFFKRNFDRCLPVFFVISIVMSLVSSLPILYGGVFDRASSQNSSRGIQSAMPFSSTNTVLLLEISSVGSIFPFLIFSVAAWLVVMSLWKHTIKMKKQEQSSFKKPSLEAHYGAAKAVANFFLFYTIFVLFFNLYQARVLSPESIGGCLCTMFIGSYPSVHSLLLVYQNNKLHKTLVTFFPKWLCCYQEDTNDSQTN